MIIDGHAHACGEFADIDQLVKLLDKLGVDKVCLCPGLKGHTNVPPLPNVPISAIKQHPLYNRYFIHPGIRFNYNFLLKEKQDGNEFVNSLVQKCPDRILQIHWLDPRKSDFMEELGNALKNWDIKGIKLHQACTPFNNGGPEMIQVVKFAGEKNLPLFIHLWSNKEAGKLIALAKEHPETNFILLHLIGLELVAQYARKLTNIYYEVSTYSYISGKRLKYAVETFGSDHIIFGSDTPFDRDALKNNMERIKAMDLSEIQKEQILGKNLQEMLKL